MLRLSPGRHDKVVRDRVHQDRVHAGGLDGAGVVDEAGEVGV
jgi:hypothetical protein